MPGRLGGPGLSEGQPRSLPSLRLFHLAFGICLPAAALAAEWGTRWCARAYVDPLPNPWIGALAAGVPLANLMQWSRWFPARAADWANSFALIVSFGYCLLFLPIVPAALILSVFAVGLLPLAPFFAFYTAWCQRRDRLTRDGASLLPFGDSSA